MQQIRLKDNYSELRKARDKGDEIRVVYGEKGAQEGIIIKDHQRKRVEVYTWELCKLDKYNWKVFKADTAIYFDIRTEGKRTNLTILKIIEGDVLLQGAVLSGRIVKKYTRFLWCLGMNIILQLV